MAADRHDAAATALSGRRSRRGVMQQGGLGLGAALVGVAGFTPDVRGQEAATAAATADEFAYLFVQTGFSEGMLEPVAERPEVSVLTLANAPELTAYFADRPGRVVGVAPTASFVETIALAQDDPPNAALVIQVGETEQDIVVVELLAAAYDLAAKTLTYEVTLLGEVDQLPGMGAGFVEPPVPAARVARRFGACTLFIDSMGCTPIDPRC